MKVARRRFSAQRHEVFNQSKPFVNIDLFRSDPALQRSLASFSSPNGNITHLQDFGKSCGTADLMKAANEAEANRPVLHNYDMYGRRIDVAEFHSAYHTLMDHGIRNGCVNFGYSENSQLVSSNKPSTNAHLTRAALIYMENQLEPGHCCPLVMSSAAIPVLRQSSVLKPWLDKLLSGKYDLSNLPISEKTGVTIGMSMTECQGGSDVRANTTLAKPLDPAHQGPDQAYLLRGHKWFTSAPMCDGFLTLAKTQSNPDLPTCFLVPRWIPTDGRRNTGFTVSRLKNKLADRANASSEVEYDDAWGQMVGEEGKGVRTILQMVQMTRLDCTLGSAGGARRSLQVALNHVSSRKAFGRRLVEQPLMMNLLGDLCLEASAHTLLAMRMAAAHSRVEDHSVFSKTVPNYLSPDTSPSPCPSPFLPSEENVGHERALFRLGVAVSKYYVTKRQPQFTYECMEALGGNGFTEDFPMANLFRHSPLNSIWEGSGNVIALDVLKSSEYIPALLKEMDVAKGMDSRFDRYLLSLHSFLHTHVAPLKSDSSNSSSPTASQSAVQLQMLGRQLADRLALGLQGSLLLRYMDQDLAQAFCQSRLGGSQDQDQASPAFCGFGSNYGSHCLDLSLARRLIEQNMPINIE